MRGAQTLQSKSINVEDAANELIDMLCALEEEEEERPGDDQDEDEDAEGQLNTNHLLLRKL